MEKSERADEKKRALVLGRFQPLHLGHVWLFKRALDECDELVIVIGSAQESGTQENPFSAEEREKMIRAVLKEERIKRFRIYAVEDINSDNEYVDYLTGIIGRVDCVYAGDNRLTAELFLKEGFRVILTNRFRGISSSEVREKMLAHKEWEELVPKAVAGFIKKENKR